MTTFSLLQQVRGRSGQRRTIRAQRSSGQIRWLAVTVSSSPNKIESVIGWLESMREQDDPPATTIFAELGLAQMIFNAFRETVYHESDTRRTDESR